MSTDKLAINWQNFARVRLQLKFAFIIRTKIQKKHATTTQLICFMLVTISLVQARSKM